MGDKVAVGVVDGVVARILNECKTLRLYGQTETANRIEDQLRTKDVEMPATFTTVDVGGGQVVIAGHFAWNKPDAPVAPPPAPPEPATDEEPAYEPHFIFEVDLMFGWASNGVERQETSRGIARSVSEAEQLAVAMKKKSFAFVEAIAVRRIGLIDFPITVTINE
jgi:hypothetical protein